MVIELEKNMDTITAGYYVGVIPATHWRKSVRVYIINGQLMSPDLGTWQISCWVIGQQRFFRKQEDEHLVLDSNKRVKPFCQIFISLVREGMNWEIINDSYPVSPQGEQESMKNSALAKAELIASGLTLDEQIDLLEELGLIHAVELN